MFWTTPPQMLIIWCDEKIRKHCDGKYIVIYKCIKSCCTPWSYTTLYVNYILLKLRKWKKEWSRMESSEQQCLFLFQIFFFIYFNAKLFCCIEMHARTLLWNILCASRKMLLKINFPINRTSVLSYAQGLCMLDFLHFW